MSTPSQSPLPDAAIQRLFVAMRASYGAAFDRQWETPAGVDPTVYALELRRHWARELAGLQPRHLDWGLSKLPERPPTLPEFKSLCYGAPPELKRLPPPKANVPPERWGQIRATLDHLRQKFSNRGVTVARGVKVAPRETPPDAIVPGSREDLERTQALKEAAAERVAKWRKDHGLPPIEAAGLDDTMPGAR